MKSYPPVLPAWLFVASSCLAAGTTHAQDLTAEDLSLPASPAPVLTPTHMHQPLRDVPATVTIIPASMVSDYGILSISEGIRFLGGSSPNKLSFADYDLKIGSHSSFGPPRVTVLIDGIEVDPAVLASASLGALPVGADDVDRIEITTGSGTAGFGHAVTTGIINIVTKHPEDVERANGRVTFSLTDGYTVFGRAGTSIGPASVRLTLSHRDRGTTDEQTVGVALSSGLSIDRFTLRAASPVGADSTLALDLAYMKGEFEGEDNSAGDFSGTIHNGYAGVLWSSNLTPSNELTLRINHWYNDQVFGAGVCNSTSDDVATRTSGALGIGPDWMDAGLPPQRQVEAGQKCRTPNSVGRRTIAEAKDEIVVSDALRLVAGLGTRQDQARDTGDPGAAWSASYMRAFAGADWQVRPTLVLSAGASADRASDNDFDLSLHGGANWHVSDDQTLRLGLAVGSWASDVQEELGQAGYLITRERMTSVDAGYRLELPERDATLNVRAFWLRLVGHAMNDAAKHGLTQARAYGELHGLEGRYSTDIGTRLKAFTAMAVQTEGANSGVASASRDWNWQGSVGLNYEIGDGWQTSAAYFNNSRDTASAQSSSLVGLNIIKAFSLGPTRARVVLTGRHTLRHNANSDGPSDSAFLSLQVAY